MRYGVSIPQRPSITLPLGEGEALTSFASRYARLYGRSVRDFCLDKGFRFQEVVDGSQEGLERLAAATNSKVNELSVNALVKQDDIYCFRGEYLKRNLMQRRKLRVCPHCLMEDLEKQDSSPKVRCFGRAIWFISAIRSCPRHHVELVQLNSDVSPHGLHDFAYLLEPFLPELEQLANAAVSRAPSDYETYLMARLDGKATAPQLLNTMPLYAVIKACHVVGSVSEYGPQVRDSKLSEDAILHVGDCGFEILKKGDVGLHALMSSLRQNSLGVKRKTFGCEIFGRLFNWLETTMEENAYESLREGFRRYVIENMPVGPGDTVLGRNVSVRRVHSIRTAATESGLDARLVRKMFIKSGYFDDTASTLPFHQVTEDVTLVREFIDRCSSYITRQEVINKYNIPDNHLISLTDSGIITTYIRTGSESGIRDYKESDIDNFIDRLSSCSAHIDNNTNCISIENAASKSHLSAGKIADYIIKGRINSYRNKSLEGYSSFFVDINELKSLKDEYYYSNSNFIGINKTAKILKTTTPVVNGLIRNGYLKRQPYDLVSNNHNQLSIDKEEVIRFGQQFCTLRNLARANGTIERKLKSEFQKNDLEPAFPPEDVNATFFGREAVKVLGLVFPS